MNYKCKCGHGWKARTKKVPLSCPKCKQYGKLKKDL